MKKLLFTAISALSICALADNADSGFKSGTTFTGKTSGEAFVIGDDDGSPDYKADQDTQWWATSGDVEGVYTNRDDLATYSGSRPTQWAGENEAIALQITDASVPLYRNIKDTKGVEVDLTNADQYWDLTSDTEGAITFDSLVLFTAADGAPSPDAEDKLVVWLLGEEEGDNPQTNLMITAGYETTGHEIVSTNYVLSGENLNVNAGEWHRLTISAAAKSISAGDTVEFSVYVDGNQVSGIPEGSEDVKDVKTTFLSRVVNNDGCQVLGGVGFKGTGAVDDLTFTTVNPFDVQTTFQMTVTVVDDNSVTDKALYVQDAVLTNNFTSGDAVDVLNETKTITIVVGVFDGYEVTGFTKGEAYANIDEDPCTYYTKDVAVTPEMLNEGYNLTIMVVKSSGGGDEPTGGLDPAGGTVAVDVPAASAADKDAAEAFAKAAITVPSGATVDKADYAEYFEYSVTGEGPFTVTITGVKDEIMAGVLESAVERLTDDEATIVEVPAGLYYSITPSTALPIDGTAVKGLSTGGTVTVGKPGTDKGFYEVKISAKPIQ